MVRLAEAALYTSLAPPGTKACDAGGGAFRPEWREGPVGTRCPKSHGGLPHFYNAKGAGTLVRLPARFVIGLTLVLHRYLCVLVELRFGSTPIRHCGLRLRNLPAAQSVRSPA